RQHTGPRLTEVGRRLARLPIDPRLGRMIIEAERLGCVREVVVIAAALSLQDPRERPEEQRPQADQLHARFADKTSDFLSWLVLWRHLKTQQKELSGSAFRRMCRREFLNYLRVREWQDFESQLRQVCKEVGIGLGPTRGPGELPDPDSIHQALLSGLLSHVGVLEERESSGPSARRPARRPMREYLGARGAKFALFPGSALKGNPPAYVMAGELVETSRLWARQNAAIKPEWAEQIGAHLVKRTHSEPHWSTKRQAVLAYERVTLYGVPLVTERLINYGKLDAGLAREIFIRHALVYGEWSPRPGPLHEFWRRNAALLAEAEELEHRARRRDIVVDEHTLFDFYDARIGADVVSVAHFDGWWGEQRRTRPELLTFDPQMLTHGDESELAEKFTAADFPLHWSTQAPAGPLTFEVAYHFEPGAPDDGVTVEVPVVTLNQVEAGQFSWNVPGLRHELVTALIRSLPKHLRVHFVPAPNTARQFLEQVPPGEESLTAALERYLRATTGVLVPPESWDWTKVPDHLRPTFRIIDEHGTETGRGKDLEALKAPLADAFADAVQAAADDSGFQASGQHTWTFGELPESFTTVRAGHQVQGFPALVDEGATVGLRVFGAAGEAATRHRFGVRRLVLLAVKRPSAANLLEGMSTQDRLALAGTPYHSVAELLDDLVAGVVLDAVDRRPPVRDEAAFADLVTETQQALPPAVDRALADLLAALAAWRETDKLLGGRAELALLPSLADMQAHLGRLMRRGLIGEFGAESLRHHPRYLSALRARRAGLEAAPMEDRIKMERVASFQAAYDARVAALPDGLPPSVGLRRLGALLEEFRVSLWAQHLRTAEPVSEQRLRKAIAGLVG
ncbi:MAG: ATP-dependent RNA helicase HrpA, partial [Nocardioides sp.]